jgi:hypothetical protein
MPTEFAPEWPDLPPVLSMSVGTDGVSVVFKRFPQVRWTVHRAVMINGRPRVIGYSAAQTGVAVPLDEVGPAPLHDLAAVWARALNLGPDGQPASFDLFDLFTGRPARRTTLGRKPDARRAAKDPDGFAEDMRRWTRPIADVIRTAAAQMAPIQAAIKAAFSTDPRRPFSDSYAERLIGWAREYHDLPKRGSEHRNTSGLLRAGDQ